jgi:hypothetical protein
MAAGQPCNDNASFHAVVWIDHCEARVFHFNLTDAETFVLQ